jgi:hypothetical protein
MFRTPAALFFVSAIFMSLSSCAGYRGGWESIPYIGDTPRAPSVFRTPYEAGRRAELLFPGLKIGINLHNQILDNRYEIYGVVPVSKSPSAEFRNSLVKPERIWLSFEVREEGFVFRPRLAVLGGAGQSVSALAGYERGKYDLSGYQGGFWKEPKLIAEEYPLSAGNYYLAVDFPSPVPGPQTPDITLDLSRALTAPGKAPIPLIRFLPVRWEEGYS